MTYREILNSSIRMVGESDENGNSSDYEERASYLLATFCTECAALDKKYRIANEMSASNFSAKAYVELEDSFPLCDVFSPAATYYLAAMLVLEENEDMSEALFARYSDALAALTPVSTPTPSSTPATCKPIVNRYPFLMD